MNRPWHADNSSKPELTSATMLYSVITPARGGKPRFADATRAYAGLSTAMRQRIEGCARRSPSSS
ncbi:TauD/TfdA family dioxygenase [Streptomyces avermitilis]|uniref:TauD/TfdA family dioxygenase n=1 Tax=Streptomyces avermitilis TaxID=33903 RepID=UPI0033EE3087